MGRDPARNASRGKAEEVSPFLDDRGADVRRGPHVGDRELAPRPADEAAGRPERLARLRRKVHGDEKPKRIGSHFGYFIRGRAAATGRLKEET